MLGAEAAPGVCSLRLFHTPFRTRSSSAGGASEELGSVRHSGGDAAASRRPIAQHRSSHRQRAAWLVALACGLALAVGGWAAARVPVPAAAENAAQQAAPQQAAETAPGAAGASETGAQGSGQASGPPPALGAIGLGGGFPSFQTVAPYISIQAQYVGLQVKTSLTAVGPYFGFELRGYPPVPIAVPLFVGVGGGIYGSNTTYFATLGAHVPLSLHVRLDVEAGAANVPLLDKRTWAPYLSLGVSYAFPFTPTDTSVDFQVAAPLTIGGAPPPVCDSEHPPSKATLVAAFHHTLANFLANARATYGSIYKDLQYSYQITSVGISGSRGRVVIHYHGSVVSIATGHKESASGTASATYVWTGCFWVTRSVNY